MITLVIAWLAYQLADIECEDFAVACMVAHSNLHYNVVNDVSSIMR
jgi:hypothetical protein